MTERATSGIRLATFNIKHGATQQGKFWGDPEQVAEACTDVGADILALQEVDQHSLRSRFVNLADFAAKAAGMEVVFAKTMSMFGGSYGNALLVRGEIADVEVIKLTGDHRHRLRVADRQMQIGHEPRNAIVATARLAGGNISVAATHLSTEGEVSNQQLTKVMAALACRPYPHVLLGDLNLGWQRVREHPSLSALQLVKGPPTYPAADPKSRIDHIAVNALAINSVQTVEFPISDHRALVADVELLRS